MARAESGELLQKPTTNQRRFPWRLWLYAIIMTGAAGAGGYFTWKYRKEAVAAVDTAATCTKARTEVETAARDHGKRATECEGQLTKLTTDSAMTTSEKDKRAKELEVQLGDVSKNLNASKEQLTALLAQKVETEKRMAAIEDLQRQFSKMIDTGQLKVTARRGSLVLSLPSEVLFSSGSAELSKPGELAVLEVGLTLKKFPERRFLVVGHTDDTPLVRSKTDVLGVPYKDNWDLSTARSLTVTRFLVQAGMKAENLVPAGVGSYDPIGKDRAKNRRIEIALLPALEELPSLPAALSEPKLATPPIK